MATDGAGNWVAVGSSGSLGWRSVDNGTTWAAATVPPGGVGYAVATDKVGRWVAVGDFGSFAWRSVDNGNTWANATTRPMATDGPLPQRGCSPERVVASAELITRALEELRSAWSAVRSSARA